LGLVRFRQLHREDAGQGRKPLASFLLRQDCGNELALSLCGWKVQDFRARVTTKQYDDGDCFHNLAVSGVFRFNEADWATALATRGSIRIIRSWW
jgi:hypothetical protein